MTKLCVNRGYHALRDKAAPPRRTRLTAERRRAPILDAATEVFAAAGYRAAKVSDVAARIGVSEPVIFQDFGSKEALYAAVPDRVAEGIRGELQTLTARRAPGAPPSCPGRDALRAMWPASRSRRLFLVLNSGSTSWGVLGAAFFAGQEGAECLPEIRADPGRPQRGRLR